MIRETVAGDFGRLDYAATGNKVVGCAWLTSLLQTTKDIMDIEQISYDDIREGDYIVRIARSPKYDPVPFFTESGIAHAKDPLGVPLYGKIEREYWISEDGTTLAYQDSEAGEPLPYFPEEIENYFRVTL